MAGIISFYRLRDTREGKLVWAFVSTIFFPSAGNLFCEAFTENVMQMFLSLFTIYFLVQ